MAIEKGFYQAPVGIASEAEDLPEIEIEIEDPESVSIEMGGLEIEIGKEDSDDDFDANLAEYISDQELQSLASELTSEFDEDINSRKDWMDTYVDGLELLGMKIEERTEPWEGACGVYHPLLSEALVKFQAELVSETLPAAGPVRTQIIGKETPEKKDAASRVQADMNYQIMDIMTEYRPEHERMAWGLGLAGNAFKKVYYDPHMERQVAMFVPAEDLVVPYGASNLETSPRVTHVMRKTENELRRLQVAGFYRDVEIGAPQNTLDEVEKKIAEKMGFKASVDDRYKLLEMHVDLDLPGYESEDGVALPYVVTIEKGTNTILAIRRNWRPDDKQKRKRTHFVHYGYVPGFGFYCFGLIHLIGAFAKSGTSLIRQLVDAGTLSNLPGGFKTRGLRIKGDETPTAPGEFRDVDVPSGTIKDNIMTLPYKEPSQTLLALMNQIVDEGRRFASASDMKVSDMSAQAPVGTTLALLERQLKVMSAVQARVHYSMKQELKLLKDIIRDYTPDEYNYEPFEGTRRAKKGDYDMVDVIPVSDPNAATMSQKVVQYQAALQLAQTAPQIYDLPVLHRQMLEVLGIKNAEKLVKLPEDQKPVDPITENMNMMNQKPAKAFLYQDHQAHIQVHMAAMQDPKIQQLIGQSQFASQISAAFQAHIAEHLAFEYRKQMEELMGTALPAPDKIDDEGMPQGMEVQVSQLAAQAANMLLQRNQAIAAQEQAQQMQQDPLVQMQQQELAIKQGELERKKMKDMVEAADKAARLELEEARIDAQKEIAGMQAGAKAAAQKADLDLRGQMEGLRAGIEIARDMSKPKGNE